MNTRIQFSDFALSREIGKAIEDMGFEEPSPIQALAIPLIQAGRDVTAQAQTGTGKTAAFGIPTIEKIDPTRRVVQAIVLCPTRELAIQIAEEFSHLLAHLPRITVLPVYGGQPIERVARECRLHAVQIHGDENSEAYAGLAWPVWRAVRWMESAWRPAPADWPGGSCSRRPGHSPCPWSRRA